MDDYYNEELDDAYQHEDQGLFEDEVIREDEELFAVHSLLQEVFRGKASKNV